MRDTHVSKCPRCKNLLLGKNTTCDCPTKPHVVKLKLVTGKDGYARTRSEAPPEAAPKAPPEAPPKAVPEAPPEEVEPKSFSRRKCKNCGTLLFGEGATCDCDAPQPEAVLLQRPRFSLGPWLGPAFWLTMALLIVIVANRAYLRRMGDEPPPDPNEVDSNKHPLIPEDEDPIPLELRERVHFEPTAERAFLSMFKRFETHQQAEEAASDSLAVLVGRIRTLDGVIAEHVGRGEGVLATPEFRARWDYLVSRERAEKRPARPVIDETMANDIVARRPVSKHRVIALGKAVMAMGERLTRTVGEERLVKEFLDSLPLPARRHLFVSTDEQREETLLRRNNPATVKDAITPGGDSVYLKTGMVEFNESKHVVSRADVLLLTCLRRGIVTTAYGVYGLNEADALNEFGAAVRVIAAVLEGRKVEPSEGELTRTAGVTGQADPRPASPEPLNMAVPIWALRAGAGTTTPAVSDGDKAPHLGGGPPLTPGDAALAEMGRRFGPLLNSPEAERLIYEKVEAGLLGELPPERRSSAERVANIPRAADADTAGTEPRKAEAPLDHSIPPWILNARREPSDGTPVSTDPKDQAPRYALLSPKEPAAVKAEGPPAAKAPRPEAQEPGPIGDFRNWKDVRNHSFQARLVAIDGRRVLLEARNRERKSFLVFNFSDEDQRYVATVAQQDVGKGVGPKPQTGRREK